MVLPLDVMICMLRRFEIQNRYLIGDGILDCSCVVSIRTDNLIFFDIRFVLGILRGEGLESARRSLGGESTKVVVRRQVIRQKRPLEPYLIKSDKRCMSVPMKWYLYI